MGALTFLFRRPILLVQGTLLDRQDPDLDRLRSIDDPDRFGWAILPHVARSFAASVVWLPTATAHAARVGYLYARMVDTYEDMAPDPAQRVAGLEWFAERFTTRDLDRPPPFVELVARSQREEVDRLLVERCSLVDRLFHDLPVSAQDGVATMVIAMAGSMERWSAAFAAQCGVLRTVEQLDEYCDDVIGEPARFMTGLVVGRELTSSESRQLSDVAVFIQLANVTRDIERDLERGIAYHPSLERLIGRSGPEVTGPIRDVRRHLLVRALRSAPSYADLMQSLSPSRVSAARGAGMVMLLFTDRYYRGCAVASGIEPWKGPQSTSRILWSSLLAALSPRWAMRVSRRIAQTLVSVAGNTADAAL